jgi:polar amino acid transport system permease protein
MIISNTQHSNDKPYWLYAMVLLVMLFMGLAIADGRYELIFFTLVAGIGITLQVAVISFFLSCTVGLLLALASLSKHQWLRQGARFYIELIRGVPALVILLYITFAATPAIVEAYQAIFAGLIEHGYLPDIQIRDVSNLIRAIVALAIAYSAFLAEVFRAGLQSIEKSQVEAAQALGLSRWLTFRLVIWPQAIKRVLPVLGNDFIAMVKDSSLVSVLGVNDITQLGKLYASASFLTVETYNVVAVLYLILTVGLSLVLRRLESHLQTKDKG